MQKANAYQRSGKYSPALVSADVAAIQALYRANGFDEATVTTDVKDFSTSSEGRPLKVAELVVTYTIVEGPQQKFGTVALNGVDGEPDERRESADEFTDGAAVFAGDAFGRPGHSAAVLPEQWVRPGEGGYQTGEGAKDPDKTDVSLNVSEGQQVFVNRVLLSGVDKTKPKVVQAADPGPSGRSA